MTRGYHIFIVVVAAASNACWTAQNIFFASDGDTDSATESDVDTATETESDTESGSDSTPPGQIWAVRAGGNGYDAATHVDALEDGSSLVVGYFEDAAVFADGETEQTVIQSDGGDDAFVARFNPDGTLDWVKRAGGPADDVGMGISALEDGVFYITGSMMGPAVFGPGEPGETDLSHQGMSDFFIARYAADGSIVWARSAGGDGQESGWCVAALPGGEAIVAGEFDESIILGFGEPEQVELTTMSSETTVFIAKYGIGGEVVWARGLASGLSSIPGGSYPRDLFAFDDGSFLLTGLFEGTCTFGAGNVNEVSVASKGGHDFFLSRYGADGTLLWVRTVGSVADDKGFGVSASGGGLVAVTGYYHFNITFGSGETGETMLQSLGSRDAFVAVYELDGDLAWARSAGGHEEVYGYGIAAAETGAGESSDTVTAVGRFVGEAVFGFDGESEVGFASAGADDIFVARYDEDGGLKWARRGGGPGSDVGNSVDAIGASVLIVAGYMSYDGTFDLGQAAPVSLSSAGGTDIFVASYGQ